MGTSDQEAPATALDDADLARLIAAGARGGAAEAEEAELCRRYVRRLYFYGLRHLGREDLAHDLAQDALVVTLEKLRAGEVREPERIGSFILGVARLLSRSGGRERARHEPIDVAGSSSLTVNAAAPDPLAREQVARCLASLHERQRAVIVLTYYAEQSTDEIASSLGLTSNNVRVIRHRGIAGLRSCLGLDHEGAVA